MAKLNWDRCKGKPFRGSGFDRNYKKKALRFPYHPPRVSQEEQERLDNMSSKELDEYILSLLNQKG